jgi:hypothetical protein
MLLLSVPGWIVNLFGNDFIKAGNLLTIIAIFEFEYVATGSIG